MLARPPDEIRTALGAQVYSQISVGSPFSSPACTLWTWKSRVTDGGDEFQYEARCGHEWIRLNNIEYVELLKAGATLVNHGVSIR